jgi:glycerate-2-kinase
LANWQTEANWQRTNGQFDHFLKISSGPTVLQESNLNESSISILKKFSIEDQKLFDILKNEKLRKLVKSSDHVHNFLIGNNTLALESARKSASVSPTFSFLSLYILRFHLKAS